MIRRWRSRLNSLIAKLRLQRLDLVADRALRDAKLLGRARKALVPRRGFEGLQGIQRRQARAHRIDFMRKTRAGTRNDALRGSAPHLIERLQHTQFMRSGACRCQRPSATPIIPSESHATAQAGNFINSAHGDADRHWPARLVAPARPAASAPRCAISPMTRICFATSGLRAQQALGEAAKPFWR